ncbi:transmembrane ascorbate-dependent reductase CYB561-like isoform X1 [Leptopilina boulardi]|uniref:transmembrane ascorbate-dependent reductase CYB561-like isoform X1 n=2 Tax=Leptopilina boulardi TaxID=63433 RepID=UPI0021F66C89|nr:transmembrane ascorbate-dependent reductase CYB561-like isoform X1 [Leptopilina boulardi]XP_051165144.1 transmembrane ascorbate-dependent reductase CYB561-like isoform X1 [Leptopilina boulardi]
MSQNFPYQYHLCSEMDQIGEPAQSQKLEGFKYLVIVTQAFGILLVILMATWNFCYRDGFAWSSDPKLQFNWHPMLMTLGLVFLYANGMLIYRTQRNVRKRRLKLIHGGIMLFVLIMTIIGLVAVFSFHNKMNIPNLYSLHSWVGLSAVILFAGQWIAGCVSFLYPGIQITLRAAYMPIHVYFGTAGFIASVASCLLGLTEKILFVDFGKESALKYQNLPPEGVLVNVIGLLFVIFGSLTVYLSSQERYKRLPRPEDDFLLSSRSN